MNCIVAKRADSEIMSLIHRTTEAFYRRTIYIYFFSRMSSPGAWCFSAFLFFLLTILASHISPQFKVGDVPLCRIEIFSDAYVENYFDSAVVLRVRDCKIRSVRR